MVKKVLITGTSGYVGKHLVHFLENNQCMVDQISVRDDKWMDKEFNNYDVVIHLAALVHNNEPGADMKRFMDVNYKLTKQLADKSKAEGVKQFIFFSTMAVFGLEGSVGRPEVVNKHTECRPVSEYGISKLKADEYLLDLSDDKFKVSIVRPPMIYGENSPGNFKHLKQYAKFIPIYFDIHNERSAIYIGNLTLFVKDLIDREAEGIYYPSDNQHLSTNNVIRTIRANQGKACFAIPVPLFVYPMLRKISFFNKLYGNLTYSDDMDGNRNRLAFINVEEAVENAMK